MAELQLIRIETESGKETMLEITYIPDSFVGGTCYYPPDHIKKLEKHYQRTGKPKRSYIDVLYLTRRQLERGNDTSNQGQQGERRVAADDRCRAGRETACLSQPLEGGK